MKITFVLKTIPRFVSGGVLVIFKYANYLSKKGYDVELLILDPTMWLHFHIPQVIRRLLIKESVRRRPTWFELNKNIKKYCIFGHDLSKVHDADIVIATAVDTAKDVSAMSNSKGRRYYFIQDYENWVMADEDVQKTYSLGLVNITVSKGLSSIVNKYSKQESICVSDGIDTNIFKVMISADKRKKHSIVFQYRSSKAKGCDCAIEVCKRIKERYPDTDIKVISNEEKPDNLPDCFHYYHNLSQERVAHVNNETSIFICTTIYEGFGLPGLEAMACGCAVVSTEYQGILEYATNGENALLSPIQDVDAMVSNIVRLFEDDALRMRIAENGAKTGKAMSWQRSSERFEKILMQSSIR